MRCKRHTSDLSSSIGVCASCLRERLLSLAASAAAVAAGDHRHSRRPDPPHLAFPRSVSPYVAPRKSDAGDQPPSSSHHRFFSTPQVGPDSHSDKSSKKKGNGFSRFSNLFRARSDEFDSGVKPSVSDNPPRLSSRLSCDTSATSSSSSSWSWLPTVISGRMRKQPTSCFIEDVIAEGDRRPRRVFCRGMSPAREEEEREPSTLASVEESPGRVKMTPATAMGTPARRKMKAYAGFGKGVSGMAFCLSPLVRANPSRHWRRKGSLQPEFRFSGDSKAPEKPHISTASSFCANRSKKLVDLGRANQRG